MEKKEKPRKKHKKYRDIKCDCGALIDIDLALELGDFDYVSKDKDKINVYCSVCGESHLVKL